MEINTNFLKNNVSVNNIEKDIIDNYINKFSRHEYSKVLENNLDLNIIYALSNLRENIVNWYDFKPNSSCLEIGSDFGEITGYLCEVMNDVVVVQESLEKCKVISKRYNDISNLEIFAGDIKNIQIDKKFDYIIIENDVKNIKYIKDYIKQDTIIILIVDNRFGMKNFAGAKNDDELFVELYKNDCCQLGKNEIEVVLKENEYTNYKFYYPLPNYKLSNVIFSDEYLPKENDTKISYNPLYNEGSLVVFNELEAMKQATKNNAFDFFANSYFIEISVSDEMKKQPKFVSYNNNRKEEYRLITKMYDEYIEKKVSNTKSQSHLKKMKDSIEHLKKLNFCLLDNSEESYTIKSKFVAGKKLDEIILDFIVENKIEQAIELINKWYEYIKSKLTVTDLVNENLKLSQNDIQNLTLIKEGYIDLVFENTFYLDEKFVFFDQEWFIENIPCEYILYRSINNMYVYNNELISKIISRDEMLERFGILKFLNTFEIIEEYIQNQIIDENMKNIVLESSKCVKNPQELIKWCDEGQKIKEELGKLKAENIKKENYILELQKKNGDNEALVALLKIEEKKKEDYIKSLEEQIQKLKNIDEMKENTINELNEIVKIKDNQISIYENMKAVKLVKKLRGNK